MDDNGDWNTGSPITRLIPRDDQRDVSQAVQPTPQPTGQVPVEAEGGQRILNRMLKDNKASNI